MTARRERVRKTDGVAMRRTTVWFKAGLAKRLALFCAARELSQTEVIEAALLAHLPADASTVRNVPLPAHVAAILREARDSLPGEDALVSPDGTEFIVRGADDRPSNYLRVAELAASVAKASIDVGGPYVSGRYAPSDVPMGAGWTLAYRRPLKGGAP